MTWKVLSLFQGTCDMIPDANGAQLTIVCPKPIRWVRFSCLVSMDGDLTDGVGLLSDSDSDVSYRASDEAEDG